MTNIIRNQKLIVISLVLLVSLGLLTGCSSSGDTPKVGEEAMVEIGLSSASLTQNIGEEINVSKYVIKVKQDEKVIDTQELTSLDDKASFKLSPGDYTVVGEAIEVIGEQEYVAYKGSEDLSLGAGEVVKNKKILLSLATGEVEVKVSTEFGWNPADVDTEIVLEYPRRSERHAEKIEWTDGEGTIKLEDVSARRWDVIFNIGDKSIKQEGVYVLPDRVNEFSFLLKDTDTGIDIELQNGPGKVENLEAILDNGTVNLTWDSLGEADFYLVYKSDEPNYATAKRIADVDENSYTDRLLISGTYYYWVEAYDRDTVGGETSEYAEIAIDESDISAISVINAQLDKMETAYLNEDSSLLREIISDYTTVGPLTANKDTFLRNREKEWKYVDWDTFNWNNTRVVVNDDNKAKVEADNFSASGIDSTGEVVKMVGMASAKLELINGNWYISELDLPDNINDTEIIGNIVYADDYGKLNLLNNDGTKVLEDNPDMFFDRFYYLGENKVSYRGVNWKTKDNSVNIINIADFAKSKVVNLNGNYMDYAISPNLDNISYYVAEENTDGSIKTTMYLNDISGDSPIKLKESNTPYESLTWGSDGKIYYQIKTSTNDAGGNESISSSRIYMANADGSNQQPLTNENQVAFWPGISLDGEKLAYVEQVEGRRKLKLRDMNDKQSIELCDADAKEISWWWTSDSQTLFYAYVSEGMGYMYSVDRDGQNNNKLLETPANNLGEYRNSLKLSPDESKVSCNFINADGVSQLYVYDFDQNTVKKIFEGMNSYVWYADNDKLLATKQGVIYLVDVEGNISELLDSKSSYISEVLWID
ncbi:Tol biopolymer transport system component [Orenia metallireducens]|jgi:Tol biopolymer transport system component|uniref:Component of the Tol biopolymer transport system n=1 Tax=Orenia metallireducens TaxID=1413210 RepID=A0A285H762_9FIRM|nr:hypothetical protein [Orenia metallireducens]PRX21134.1 Tol biopolymer transport system component [Orenia metallireducens]SNY31602.1 component of the Tol biopolymer transport system [Orenia metallireducens]